MSEPTTRPGTAGPRELAAALTEHDYLPSASLATAAHLAVCMQRPLFCEGEPGVGKTSLAIALAAALGGPLVRLQCYEGIDSSQALYDWDFPRQLMHLRASGVGGPGADAERIEASLYSERFLLDRPILRALRSSRPGAPAVLLIDEIDRADDEFEAFLLEVLDEWAVTIPEFGRVAAAEPPVAVITSNRTREVHDALKRRCLYHWLDLPSRDEELAIVRRRLPGVGEALAARLVDAVRHLRELPLSRRPGVAETLDWVRALDALGVTEAGIGEEALRAGLGTLVKDRDDEHLVAGSGWAADVVAPKAGEVP